MRRYPHPGSYRQISSRDLTSCLHLAVGDDAILGRALVIPLPRTGVRRAIALRLFPAVGAKLDEHLSVGVHRTFTTAPLDPIIYRLRCHHNSPAKGIETRRAETLAGSVEDESPVRVSAFARSRSAKHFSWFTHMVSLIPSWVRSKRI